MPQTTLESAFNTVKKLVEDFDGNKDYYLTPVYSEQSARHDFVDKFFIALGWDVNHETDKNPYEQEAHIESNVDAQGKRKRADYAFYVAPNFRDVAFYAEAKKPSVQIANADDYFQTIRYGYSSETPLAVITDFEEFHILDCRYTPSIETALDRFVKKYTYQDYLSKDKFAEIYYLFSREAVAGGSIQKRALELPKARGGAVQLGLFKGAYKPIDEALLDELDEYRNALAHAFKNGNPELDHWALTEIVQRTIDRLVFIRFLEDKLIEPEEIISNFGTKSESVWKDFVSTCRKLDKVYNGTIYKKHGILDAPDFKFDENVFADICERLSSKNTPYDFDKIPIHILGSIYERFLGKIITTTAKRAKVEEKPEVKKAGGVFYTPEYIVRYIVENTIGKLIKDKTPEEISEMRFADIACGSGSFLLGAYDCLLRFHANYYNQNPKETTARDCVDRDGAPCLTLHKKREILLNNIYGVDIDQQAVEVSQLSLYLKLLENETLGTTAASLRAETGETVLPSLNRNIQCGNSLIEPDFYVGVQEEMALYENKKEEVREINSFDWQAGFPEIMRSGGFDAVIGNPPYGADFDEEEKEYIRRKYKTYKYRFDSYIYFIEKAITKVKNSGYVSYITPELWLNLENCEALRHYVAKNASLNTLRICGENVFADAVVNTVVFILCKEKQNKNITIENLSSSWKLPSSIWKATPDLSIEYRITPDKRAVINKVSRFNTNRLENYGSIIQGITPYDKYQGQTEEIIKKRAYHFATKKNSSCGKWLEGKDVSRYILGWSGEWLSYGPWLGAPREPHFFTGPRILFREVPGAQKRIQAVYAEQTLYHGHSITPFKPKNESKADCLYVLGIVNSRLLSWFGGIVLPNLLID